MQSTISKVLAAAAMFAIIALSADATPELRRLMLIAGVVGLGLMYCYYLWRKK